MITLLLGLFPFVMINVDAIFACGVIGNANCVLALCFTSVMDIFTSMTVYNYDYHADLFMLYVHLCNTMFTMPCRAQWLSNIPLDSRLRGLGFESCAAVY